MKEKTFQEIIENYTFYDRSDYAKKEPLLDKVDVLNLLHQVREATIAECFSVIQEIEDMETAYNYSNFFNEIKTDRIETEY